MEAKVAEMAFERRRQVKKQSGKAKHKDSTASSAAASMPLKAAVQEIDTRSRHYRRTATRIARLVEAGIWDGKRFSLVIVGGSDLSAP